MHINPFLAAVSLALLSFGTSADEREYKSVEQFTSTLSPAPVWQVAEGDLNGDGLSDRAIVTHKPNSDVSPQIYILLQNTRGGFSLAQQSKPGGHNGSVELEIKNGSLYVHLESIKCCEQATHQFKLYRGVWRLIGMTHLISASSAKPDGGPNFVRGDINLLTGDILFGDDESGRTRRAKASGQQCLLADYDFDFVNCVDKWKTDKGLPVTALIGG
jgi:hypothetical protein